MKLLQFDCIIDNCIYYIGRYSKLPYNKKHFLNFWKNFSLVKGVGSFVREKDLEKIWIYMLRRRRRYESKIKETS